MRNARWQRPVVELNRPLCQWLSRLMERALRTWDEEEMKGMDEEAARAFACFLADSLQKEEALIPSQLVEP